MTELRNYRKAITQHAWFGSSGIWFKDSDVIRNKKEFNDCDFCVLGKCFSCIKYCKFYNCAVYNSEIGNPAMFIIKASIVCCCVLSCGKILEKSKMLERIGRNSAVIYGLHFLFFDITIVFEETAMKYLSITKISGTMILASMALVIVEIISNGNEKLKQRWRLKTSG